MDRGLWHCTGDRNQDHLQEKEMQKGKMAVWGGLKIAEKRKEAKGKGEKKRYIHLNAEFQRIPRRDKEAFFSDQCKEIEENNRMGKTRDLFKKIRDIKGTFHAKMDTIKDRNGIDRTEAEDIKKRWQEYISSVQFSCLVVSDTLQPHESQYARPPCPSPTPGVHSNPYPLCAFGVSAETKKESHVNVQPYIPSFI